jgi:carboxylesterase type B
LCNRSLLTTSGRDDQLFRGAIAESGGPAVSFFPSTVPGGYNSTAPQLTYNALLANTSCASTVNTASSLSCLRSLPFAELNAALNTSSLGNFVPVIDNDFIATHPSIQLSKGNFVRVPLIIGTNTDEGTAFGVGYNVSTDSEFLSVLSKQGMSPSSSAAAIVSALYPNIQALGIPSLISYPELIPANFSDGSQFRRLTSYFGDVTVNAPRRAANHAWSKFNVPSYSYRFDVTVNGVPKLTASTHFQEVAFVFGNVRGEGYAVNPFGDLTEADQKKFNTLATEMSGSWVRFVTTGVPNGDAWPAYDIVSGGGEGKNRVFSVNGTGSYVETDTYRAEGIEWISENALSVYGR